MAIFRQTTAAGNGALGLVQTLPPYFRIQNPWTQTATYDPEGRYIKRWIPELRDVNPARFTHAPEQKLATDYPLPMVDHAQEREIAWERFRASRTS